MLQSNVRGKVFEDTSTSGSENGGSSSDSDSEQQSGFKKLHKVCLKTTAAAASVSLPSLGSLRSTDKNNNIKSTITAKANNKGIALLTSANPVLRSKFDKKPDERPLFILDKDQNSKHDLFLTENGQQQEHSVLNDNNFDDDDSDPEIDAVITNDENNSKSFNTKNKTRTKKSRMSSAIRSNAKFAALSKSLYVDLKSSNAKNRYEDIRKKTKMLDPKQGKKRIDELLKKSVITDDFLNQETVAPYYQSVHAQRKKRKEEREKTKGKNWFDLPATEMTEERKRDLEIVAMRDVLDTKTFYRKDDRRILPKYFQIGTVVEDPTDFYSDRLPKKQRKQTIVEELLADAEFKKKQKQKYKEIMRTKKNIPRHNTGLKFKKKKKRSNDFE